MSVLPSVSNVKAVVATFNQEKALVGAFSEITNLRMELFEALVPVVPVLRSLEQCWRHVNYLVWSC